VRDDLHARDDAAGQGGAGARLPRPDRGGHVRAPGGAAVPAVHRPRAADGPDARHRQARPLAGGHPGRRMKIEDRGSRIEDRIRTAPAAVAADQTGPASSPGPRSSILDPRSSIFLIGYRGTGKSTVARLLAGRLGWGWLDADAALEHKHGRTVR